MTATRPGAAAGEELLALSTTALSRALRHREVSAREVLQAHLARIEQVNETVNAVVTLVPDQAMAAAMDADERAATHQPGELPPLHGVPMTHKDTHLTAGVRTTFGSPVHADLVPTESDLVVERLQQAGVVTTGKNNVPEFAAGSHTFNEVFGTTANPYDLTRSAGGSSGGAAVALATRIQPLADGSDMGGSLRNPASFCNVVGFRPSAGVLPMAPTRNAWAWLARTGPMARTVQDVALAMSVLAGPDPRVPLACPAGPGAFAALAAALDRPADARPLEGIRVAYTEDFGLDVPVEPEVLTVLREQADVLTGLGAVVEDGCPELRGADEVFDVQRAFDMAVALRQVVAEHRDRVKAEVVWNVERGLALTAPDLMDAAVARTRLHVAVRRFFDRFDVLLCPTSQVPPFPADERWPRRVAGVEMSTYVEWMRSACLVSATGCPAVSVPAGFTPGGLPVGAQLVAAEGKDVSLLRVAHHLAAATGHADRAPRL